ncbi:MAG: hypothetical protein U0T83_07450 [Bacteriovoracaceae bacterium]
MEKDTIIYKYSPLIKLTDDVWTVEGEWKKSSLGRRMTIIASNDKRLLIHNPIKMRDEDLVKISELGKVTWILAPNLYHTGDAGWMKEQFSDALLFLPPKLQKKSENTISSWELSQYVPYDEFRVFNVQGLKIEEVVIYHRKSKTLVLCDLAFNMPDIYTGFKKYLMRLNNINGNFAPTKILKLFFVKNKQEFYYSIKRIAQLDFTRVIVNHGEVLENHAMDEFRESFEKLFHFKL